MWEYCEFETGIDGDQMVTCDRVIPKTRGVEYPCGFWECTFAIKWIQDAGFRKGDIYECRLDRTGSPRIYPHGNSDPYRGWAPFWVPREDRFCYHPYEMKFKYLGIKRPRFLEASRQLEPIDSGNTWYVQPTILEERALLFALDKT